MWQTRKQGWFRDLVPRFVSSVLAACRSVPEGFKVRIFRCRIVQTGLLVGSLILSGATCLASPESYTARATRVSDGDTLWVQPTAGGAPRKLRLHGVDAPEICQTGGRAARDALRTLVQDRTLWVRVKYQDDYGRGLAHIEVNGQDLAATLVRQGQAWSYRWRRSPGPYAREEAQARKAGLGVFAEAAPELPADFRRRHGSCYLPDAQGGFKLK